MSRRKDGQKFKLFVEPKIDEDTTPLRVPLAGVFSRAICVMSKRKTGERIVATALPPRVVKFDSSPSAQSPIFPPALAASNFGAAVPGGDMNKLMKSLMNQVSTLSQQILTMQDKIDRQVALLFL